MESGNSSSMQSSSGGGAGDDQEYESSGATAAAAGNFFFSNTNNPPPQYHHPSSIQQLMFNNPPLSQHNSYLDAFGDHQANFQNMLFWQQHQQQHQLSDLSNNPSPPQPPPPPSQPPPLQTNTTTTTHPLPSTGNISSSTKPSTSTAAGSGQSSGQGSGQKNSRKRTRASRRAPTTVLTTDTSNFRAMVQEFTGIPSSPFTTAASPFVSRRLTDLFTGSAGSGLGSSSLRPPIVPSMGGGGGGGGSNLERLLAGYARENYPYRPAPQKAAATLASTSSNANTSLIMNINTSTNTATNAPLSLPDQHNIIRSGNNNNLPFQSLLQLAGTSTTPSSSAGTFRYNSPTGLLSGSGTSFQDLSGVVLGGNEHHHHQQQQMFMSPSDPHMGSGHFTPPMRLGSDGSGGWRDGSSNDQANIGATTAGDGSNNESNQQMEGSVISGSGTSNYHHHSNVNVNCSRDKGLDNSGGGQGTLGRHFLD